MSDQTPDDDLLLRRKLWRQGDGPPPSLEPPDTDDLPLLAEPKDE